MASLNKVLQFSKDSKELRLRRKGLEVAATFPRSYSKRPAVAPFSGQTCESNVFCDSGSGPNAANVLSELGQDHWHSALHGIAA